MIVPRNQAFKCNPFLKDFYIKSFQQANEPKPRASQMCDLEISRQFLVESQPDMFQIGDPFKQCGRKVGISPPEKWGASPFRRSRSEWSDIYHDSLQAGSCICRVPRRTSFQRVTSPEPAQ